MYLLWSTCNVVCEEIYATTSEFDVFVNFFPRSFLGVGFLSTNLTYSDSATLHTKISRLDREITVRFAADMKIYLFNILPLLFRNLFF